MGDMGYNRYMQRYSLGKVNNPKLRSEFFKLKKMVADKYGVKKPETLEQLISRVIKELK